jgi:hypothetical protein
VNVGTERVAIEAERLEHGLALEHEQRREAARDGEALRELDRRRLRRESPSCSSSAIFAAA